MEIIKKSTKSIKRKITAIVMLFVSMVLVGFEIFSYRNIRNYYDSAVLGGLLNQAKIDSSIYQNNLSNYSVDQIIIGDKDSFYRNNQSQVQIFDNAGTLLYDSNYSEKIGRKLEVDDVKKAKDGTYSYLKYYDDLTNSDIISLSYPLINDHGNQIGILRLSSSLVKVDDLVKSQFVVYLIFGLVIWGCALFVANFASKKLVEPIKELTNVSEKLAAGDFMAKADTSGDDEIAELAATLNFMSDNIIKREDLKNEFISSVSHELRTPLTSIKGWAITLQSKEVQKDEDMLSQGLSIIENEGDRLSMMVEDLLDFSRLSSSGVEYDREVLNIVDLVKEVYDQLYPRSLDEKISFNFISVYKYIPVNADKNRMKEVFINIIDNAMKFTPENGNIDVIFDTNTDSDKVTISVKDNGEGIKEDEIQYVASKFYKGSSSKSQTGLGLSICEEIVKAHGGKLIIKSKYTVGTTVSVELPKAVINEKA